MKFIAPAMDTSPGPVGPNAMGQQHFVDRWIFVFMAGWFVTTALAGFIPVSISKINAVMAGERPPFPAILHIHAILMGAWLLLLLAQTWLMATGRRALHKQLGLASLVLAPAIVIAGIYLLQTVYTERGAVLADMDIEAALDSKSRWSGILLEQFRMGIAFTVLVGWALIVRKSDPQVHKRLMILATVYPLLAGIDRLPWLPKVLADRATFFDLALLIWIAPILIWDLVRSGRVQKSYLIWFGVGIPLAIPIHVLWGNTWWIETAGSWFDWPT